MFFVRKSFDLAWYTYIDIVVVGLCISSSTYWFLIFINLSDKFELPLKNENDFNKWAIFAHNMRIFTRVSAMTVVLMSIRNLRVLTTQLPAFGVLFDTIRKAKIDLLYLFIVTNNLNK